MSTQSSEHDIPARGGPISNLQASLHSATRLKHANLNRAITSRLPLCLPPHTTSPLAYHLGMLAFATIYKHLEHSMDSLTQDNPTNLVPSGRHVQIVQRLFTEGLGRSQQLQHDSEVLRKRLINNTQQPAGSVSLQEIEEQVESEARIRTAHLQKRFENKPYLMLAYAWAMYLALFNGGRWLLRQLESAGPDFWLEDTTQSQSIGVLSFWQFDLATLQDPNADQLKNNFKDNLDSASSLLTEEEVSEIVQEGPVVFDLCSDLIKFLDAGLKELEQSSAILNPHSVTSLDQQLPGIMWQAFQSILLGPAHQIIRRLWTRPFDGSVRSTDG